MSIIYRPAQGYGLTVIYCCQFPFYQPDGFVQKTRLLQQQQQKMDKANNKKV